MLTKKSKSFDIVSCNQKMMLGQKVGCDTATHPKLFEIRASTMTQMQNVKVSVLSLISFTTNFFSILKLMPCKAGSQNCEKSLDNSAHELTMPVPQPENCCVSLGWQ